MKYCIDCGVMIAAERLSVVPDTRYCSLCVRGRGPARVRGANIYLHKTAPSIQVMSSEFYNKQWKRYTSDFGRGSGIHKITKPTACI